MCRPGSLGAVEREAIETVPLWQPAGQRVVTETTSQVDDGTGRFGLKIGVHLTEEVSR